MGNEKIKFTTSRKLYMPFYTMMAILILLIVYIKLSNLALNTLTLIGTAIFIVLGISLTETHRLRDTYYLSNEHVEHQSGYIAKEIKKILISSITDINLKQKVWERIFRYGSVKVQSSSGSNHIDVRNINNPHKFINVLEKKMEVTEKR